MSISLERAAVVQAHEVSVQAVPVTGDADIKAMRIVSYDPVGGVLYPASGKWLQIGVTNSQGNVGEIVSVYKSSVKPIMLAKDVPAGAVIKGDSDGKGLVAGGGENGIGISQTAGLEGSIISIDIHPGIKG